MVSEKEIEAAREAWREYWSDAISQYEDNKSPMEGMRRALEAAARVRAEAAEGGEVVASIPLGKGNVIDCGGANISQPLHNKRITIRDREAHPSPQLSGVPTSLADAEKAFMDRVWPRLQNGCYRAHGSIPVEIQGLNFNEFVRDGLCAVLSAAPQPSGPVQVKPLEWSSRYCLHLAYSGFGTYRIEDQGSNWKEDRYWLDHNGERIGKFPTLEAAKSAAQADYERHILSALTAGKPHPDDEAVDRFAAAMKAKLKWEREERGRHGWNDPEVCSEKYLARLLIEHLAKGNDGNFEDVANFCMMLHQRGAHPRVLADALARAEANAEPVAWRYKLFESDPEWTVTTEKPQGVVVEPLFTRPSEQAVTEVDEKLPRTF